MLATTVTQNILTLRQVITKIAIIIAIVELLVMMMFLLLPWQFSDFTITVLDTLLLTLFSTPIIYFFIIKKFIVAHQQEAREVKLLLDRLNNHKQVLDEHAIVATTDLKGTITFVNKKFCEVSQYSKQALIGNNHRLLNSGYHSRQFFNVMYKTLTRDHVWHGEICNRNKSGELYWVNTTIATIFTLDGKPESYIAIRNEITEQKNAELAAKKALSLLETTMNSTDNGILVVNKKGDVIQTNQQLFTLWDIEYNAQNSQQTLIKMMINKMVNGLNFQQRLRDLYNKEDQNSSEMITLKNGNILTASSKSMFTDNKIMGRVWSFQDVTDRIKFEQQLAITHQLTQIKLAIAKTLGQTLPLKKRFEQSLAELIALDTISKKHCAMVFELTDDKLSVIASKCPAQDNVDGYEIMLTGFLKEEPFSVSNGINIHHYSKGANQEFLTCYLAPLIDKSQQVENITGYLMLFAEQTNNNMIEQTAFIQEIAELFSTTLIREQAHALLKQASQAALQNNQLKSEFLASMSHEIRTPMNGVLGMLGLLLQSNLTQDQQHKASLAQTSAESLLTLINDILDFSKVEAGKLELEILDFDLRGMLGELAEAMALRAQAKGVEIVLDVTEIEHSMVKGDPGRIRQILTNLVGNAIKFTEQGEIVIRAKVTQLTSGEYQFSCVIQDTGIGIPADKLSTLFDAFSQVDASTTRKYGGTGLGLSICKKLIQLMGGDISVSSEFSQGSCFSFNLLIEISQMSQKVLPQVDISQLSLLIVDDNATNRAVLRGQLEHWGITVSEADSGKVALQRCQQLIDDDKPLFDVAFLDMQMPEMDGEVLGKKLHAHPMFCAIKLIMMTSIASIHEASYFAHIGFHGYFPKPATTSDLFNALNVVMSDEFQDKDNGIIVTHDYLSILKNPNDLVVKKDSEGEAVINYRLLLVEDNRINQMVAQGVLDKFGLYADVAANGLEAIESIKMAPFDSLYDLVLMDCQMPEMDGYEATQQIRAGKAGAKNATIPIVAMTANAMQGDREKCLSAGMDDYLSKPIEPDELLKKLNQWLNHNKEKKSQIKALNSKLVAKEPEHSESQTSDTAEQIEKQIKNKDHWNKNAVLKRVMGKEKLLRALVVSFNDEMPARIKQLNNIATKDDHDNIQMIAHTIKGVAGNLGGEVLQENATQLEAAAKQQTGDYQRLINEVNQSYHSLNAIFVEFLSTATESS